MELCVKILLILFSISSPACSQIYKRATKVPERSFLLYIEDVDGQDGIYAGNFGEIVCLDIENRKKSILTKDNFFDEYANILSDNRSIVFQSKRKLQGEIGDGLGISNKLYVINIESGNAKMLDISKFSTFAYSKESYIPINCPAVAHYSDKMAFTAECLLDEKSRLYIYDFNSGKLNVLIPNRTTFTVQKVVWSDNDSIIAFNKGNNSIRLYIVDKAVIDSITEPDYTIDLGDIRHDTLVYCAKDWVTKNNFIYLVDLKTKSKKTIFADTTQSDLTSPCFGEDGIIYFIKVTDNKVRDGYYPQDIFSYNIVTGQILQITLDGNAKKDLKWNKR